MRVTCPYCDSVVEAEDNMRCPNCSGSISNEIRLAEEHFQKMQAEAAEIERKKQEEERDSRMLETLIPVVGAVLGGGLGRGLFRTAIRKALKYRNKQ